MTTEEMSQHLDEFIRMCRARVETDGAAQYVQADGSQLFEHMPIEQLFTYFDEEMFDIVNYIFMLYVRMVRLRRNLDTAIAGTRRVKQGPHAELRQVGTNEPGPDRF